MALPINNRKYRVVCISDDLLRKMSAKSLKCLQLFMGFVVAVNYKIENRTIEYVVCSDQFDPISWGAKLPRFKIECRKVKRQILFKWVKIND